MAVADPKALKEESKKGAQLGPERNGGDPVADKWW